MMLRGKVRGVWSEGYRDGDSTDKAPDMTSEKVSAGYLGTGLGLVLQWTLAEYRRECINPMDKKHFGAREENGQNLVI